jgi:hypothetical protein
MKKIISLFLAGLYFFPTGAYTQTGHPANIPSQTTYSAARLYMVFLKEKHLALRFRGS